MRLLAVCFLARSAFAANCVSPNTTIQGYFCIGGAASLYNEDDELGLGEIECPNNNNADAPLVHVNGVNLPSNVRGDTCACDYGETHPNPIIQQRTHMVTCEYGPLNVSIQDISGAIRKGQKITVTGACSRPGDKCVGFYTKTWIGGNEVVLPGVCQSTSYSNATSGVKLFKYPVKGSRQMEISGDGDECDCHSQRPEWKSLRMFSKSDTGIDNIFRRATGSDFVEGGPCEAVTLGWGWRWNSDPKTGETILTIPPGSGSTPVEMVKKTGTIVKGHANTSYACGSKTHFPVGSITLKDYCSMPPIGIGNSINYNNSGAYNVEIAATIYGIRNLLHIENKLRTNGQTTYLGLDVSNGFVNALASLVTDSQSRRRRTLALLLALIDADLDLGTRDMLRNHPPYWHGNEGFPSSYDATKPDFHIGVPSFKGTIVDPDGSVSPFRLLFYHFSTAMVDYGMFVNNNNLELRDNVVPDLHWDNVWNSSGSHLGTHARFNPAYPSGYESRFLSNMEAITGRLTLPGMGLDARGCFSADKEKMCSRYFRDKPNHPAMRRACEPTPKELDVDILCKVNPNLTIIDMFKNIEYLRTQHPFNDSETTPCTITLQETGKTASQTIETIGYCLREWDVGNQFMQIVTYALPMILMPSFFDSLYKEWQNPDMVHIFTDVNNARGLLSGLNNDWKMFSADLDWGNFMWRPTNMTEWSELCESRSFPVPGMGGGGAASGCPIVREKPTGPYDGFSHSTGRCEQLTSLPFGLEPTSDELVAVFDEVQISEAVAAAAWPYIADYMAGFKRVTPVEPGAGASDVEAVVEKARRLDRYVDFFAAKCAFISNANGVIVFECYKSPRKVRRNDNRIAQSTSSVFIYAWILEQNEQLNATCNVCLERELSGLNIAGSHNLIQTCLLALTSAIEYDASDTQKATLTLYFAQQTVLKCMAEDVLSLQRLPANDTLGNMLREYDSHITGSMSIATAMLGQLREDAVVWDNLHTKISKNPCSRPYEASTLDSFDDAQCGKPVFAVRDDPFFKNARLGCYGYPQELDGSRCGADNLHFNFLWEQPWTISINGVDSHSRHKFWDLKCHEDNKNAQTCMTILNRTQERDTHEEFGGNVYWSMIGGTWKTIEHQHVKREDAFYTLERFDLGNIEDLNEFLLHYVGNPSTTSKAKWVPAVWLTQCVERTLPYLSFRGQDHESEKDPRFIYNGAVEDIHSSVQTENPIAWKALMPQGDPNINFLDDSFYGNYTPFPLDSTCNHFSTDMVWDNTRVHQSSFASCPNLGTPNRGSSFTKNEKTGPCDQPTSVHGVLNATLAIALANFGYLAAAKALPWSAVISEDAGRVFGCGMFSNYYPNRNGNILAEYMQLWPTAGCAKDQPCSYFAEAGARPDADNLDSIANDPEVTSTTGRGDPIIPEYRFLPTDMVVQRLKFTEDNVTSVSSDLLHGKWDLITDYSTLRSDTAWGQTLTQKELLDAIDIPPENTFRCRFNRCGGRAPAFHYVSAHSVRAVDFDSETGSGHCYATQDDGKDMNTNALYRRRHFVNIMDVLSDGGVEPVMSNGQTPKEFYTPRPFKPMKGSNPQRFHNNGFSSITKDSTNLAIKHDITEEECPHFSSFDMRTDSQLDRVGGTYLKYCRSPDEGDSVDSRCPMRNNIDGAHKFAYSACANPFLEKPLLNPRTGAPFDDLDASEATYGDGVYGGYDCATTPDYNGEQYGACHNDEITPEHKTNGGGGFFTQSELKLAEWIKLVRGDNAPSLVAISGHKLRIKFTNASIIDRLPNAKIIGNNLVEIEGEKDGVPFFESRTMQFPSAWRIFSRRENLEKPEFLNPFEERGLSPEQGRAWCARQETERDCWRHRACDWTDGRCLFDENAPDCVTDTHPNHTEWTRPCMEPTFPVCVSINRLTDVEGVQLTGDGSRHLAHVPTPVAVCVPLTRKIKLDSANYKTIFEDKKYWRPNCAFAVGKHIDCKTPPATMMGRGDSVTGATSVQTMSKWVQHTHPISFFSASPLASPKNFSWGFNHAMGTPVRDYISSIDDIHDQWTHQDVFVNGDTQFARLTDTTGYPNCGPGDSACALLIDNITSVPCERIPVGSWTGRCVKPELQLVTPQEFESMGHQFLKNAFQTYDLPYERYCLVYDPAEQYMASVPRIMWPPDSIDNTNTRASLTNSFEEYNDTLQYVHYCSVYRNMYPYCDNDPLSREDRTTLCTEWGGSLLYSGVIVTNLKVQDMCDTEKKVCYFLPNAPNIGTFKTFYEAMRSTFGSVAGYTIRVLPFDHKILKNLLLGAMLEDVVITNAPKSTTDHDVCNRGTTFLCKSPAENGQVRAGIACYEDPDLGLPVNEKLIRGQRLFEKGAQIGDMMCNPHHPPDLEVFRIIRSLKEQWDIHNNYTYPNGKKVYRIVGIDAPSHNREAYDSRIDIDAAAFETRNLSGADTIKVVDGGLTIEPAFADDIVHMGGTKIEVAAEGFAIRKAIFYSHETPITFSGTSAEDATIVNVTSMHSPMVVAFLGAATDFVDYAPAVSVRNVMLEDVVGSEFIAGFARATGEPRVIGCPPSLSGGRECYIPTPSGDPCSTWGSAYTTPSVQNKGSLWDTYETWLQVGNHLVTTDGHVMRYDNRLFRYKNRRLMIGDLCMHVPHHVGDAVVVGSCAENAAQITRTGHVHGDPFHCLRQKPADKRPVKILCKPCSVGSTPYHVHVNTTGIACVDRPTGIEIAACTTTPNGAVHTLLDTSICNGTVAYAPIPGGHGGLYDCNTNQVVVGGYGYTSSRKHQTTAIIIQPESHLQQFDVEAPGVEIVNVTAITGIFGDAYVKTFIHTPPRQDASAFIILIILGSVLGALIITHFGLVYYEERTILALGGKLKNA